MSESNGARVFVSFDIDHDTDLGDQLVEQSQRGATGFHVVWRSAGGAMTNRWHREARKRLRDVDEVIVICGEHTAASDRVNAELRMAQEEKKPYLLIWGRRGKMCSMPLGLKRTASMYSWTWETLFYQVAQTLREGRPLEIPERYKRP